MIGNYIKTKSGNSKLAIIIATVNVPKTLLRTLNSYNKVGTSTPIYILSNNPEKAEQSIKSNFNYLKISILGFDQNTRLRTKISEALKYVDNEIFALCTDDDYAPLKAIHDCSDFLEKNHDYSACQGHHLGFTEIKNEIFFNRYLYFTPSITMENPLERLQALITRYQPVNWAVLRRNCIEHVYEMVDENDCAFFHELKWSSTAAILGKIKRMDFVYNFRREGETKLEAHPSFALMEDPGGFLVRYSGYRNKLIELLEKSKFDGAKDSVRAIDCMHLSYLAREMEVGPINFFTEKIVRAPGKSIHDPDISKIFRGGIASPVNKRANTVVKNVGLFKKRKFSTSDILEQQIQDFEIEVSNGYLDDIVAASDYYFT